MSELTKREWVYVQPPKEYEISGCPRCRNADVMFSEYEHHYWCPICQIDYVPECSGIFEGPVPVNICRLLGIDLRQVNIATGEIREP